MATLDQLIAEVRRALGDADVTQARWTSEDLEAHLRHAIDALSQALPRSMTTTLTAPGGTRDLDIAGLGERLGIEAVEYPVGQYPRVYSPFSQWADTLTLLVEAPPAAGTTVTVLWYSSHQISPQGTTLPPWAEGVLVQGAAGFAALEWASQAVNQVNAGGQEVWRHYLTMGQQHLAAFHGALAQYSRRTALQPRQLYVPAQPKPNQSTDWGP